MRSFAIICAALLAVTLSLTLNFASAQAQGVVQLPTFQFFGVNTTVSVPDGGTASLGGSSSGFYGNNQRGIPGFGHFGPLSQNRGLSGGGSVSGISTSVWIHDQNEMDAEVLGMPTEEFQRRALAAQRIDEQTGFKPKEVNIALRSSMNQEPNPSPLVLRSTSTAQEPVMSLAEIKRMKALRTAANKK